jgi:nitrite reductase/ring-hydroxylating ferredoxin subunit
VAAPGDPGLTAAVPTVELGRAADFTDLPARVEVVDTAYYLVRDGARWRLFAAVCPHTGGDVRVAGTVFQCPNHSWTFHRSTGAPLGDARQPLSRYDVAERDGVLVADVEAGGWYGVRARQRREARG